MPWPSVPTITNIDDGTDSAASGRQDIEDVADAVIDIINMRGAADGICELDATGKIPEARYPFSQFVGEVASDGTAVNLPAGWSSAKITTGQYRVTKTDSTTDYYVFLTCTTNSRFPKFSTKAATTFDVLTVNFSDVASDAGFHFFLHDYS